MGIIRAPIGSTASTALVFLLRESKIKAMQPFEVVYVKTNVVACCGEVGADGHPRVYLNLSAEGKIECPYCSRLFVHESKRGQPLAAGPAAGGPHHTPKP
jgi:uncharacterized Zn-finger protein